MNDTKKFTFSEDVNGLPTLQELQSWSFQTSLQRSTNKLTVTDEIIQIVKADALAYYDKLADDTTINNYVSRIKSSDSIELKSQRHPDLRSLMIFLEFEFIVVSSLFLYQIIIVLWIYEKAKLMMTAIEEFIFIISKIIFIM